MKLRSFLSVVVAGLSLPSLSSPFDAALLVGRTDKPPASYAVGEPMTLTLSLVGIDALPAGEWFVEWTRTGDDGRTESGRAPAALGDVAEIRTSLDRPGFVRVEAFLVGAKGERAMRDVPAPGENWYGAREVFFSGGAGAGVDRIRQGEPEPEDFDAFWDRQRAALAAVPFGDARRNELASPDADVRLYAVRIPCAGAAPVTGYLTVPKRCDGGAKAGALVMFDGYGTSVQRPPAGGLDKGRIRLHINAHGYELGRDEAYYRDFFAKIESNGKSYARDPVQNADPEGCYFRGMALRVMRALQYVESLPEWDGKELEVLGGSQGGLQAVWGAALDPRVSKASPFIIWCCDIGKHGEGRLRSESEPDYTPALRYFDAANMARRIRCDVHVTRAGLGDYLSPPSGIAAFYNNLMNAKTKTIDYVQGSRHGYVPPSDIPASRGTAAAASDAVELVENVDMETLDDKGVPVGWGDATCRPMKDPDGNHYVRIVQRNPGTMTSIYRKHDIPAGCRKLAISLRGRVTGLVLGDEPWYDARVIANIKNAEGTVVKADAVIFHQDTDGWERKSKVIDLPEGAVLLEYLVTMFNCKAGAFDVDDLRVTLLKSGDAPPEEAPRPKRVALLPVPSRPALGPDDELRVKGNRLVNRRGEEVWLQGVAVCSMEWMAKGDHVRESFEVAIGEWNANVIRLALHSKFWFGEGGAEYRALVDELVGYANGRGCYVVLDLHEYRAPTEKHARFWTDCAARFANRPGVLFDILNEPYQISWNEWRNGGELKDGNRDAPAESEDGRGLTETIGMQKLVEVVRATGARNVVIAGGLDWSYDCSGILDGFALDDPGGNGIAYSVHVYPWKSDWQGKFLACAEKYPLFLGEVGCMMKKMPFEKTLVDPYQWAPDILACIQRHRLCWTAWSFHTQAQPCVLADWNYTPTPCWGSFVMAALKGARFESDRLR